MSMKKLLLASFLGAISTGATAATVDFGNNFNNFDSAADTTVHGEIVSRFDFGNGLTGHIVVSNPNEVGGVGEARIFDTRLTGTSDDDLEGDFENVADSNDDRDFGKALIIQERASLADSVSDDERGGGIVTFFFDTAINLLNLTYLDGERGAIVSTSGTELGDFGSGVSGDHKFVELNFERNSDAFGIRSFSVQYNGSGAIGAFDAEVSPIPLPAALSLMLAGLGGLGVAGRKRKAS